MPEVKKKEMKNIIKIIKDDFKKLCSSTISLCVVFGLIVVPTIYSLFNIAGYWDPYSGTSQLQIGIVNEDEAYKTDVLPLDINLGESVMSVINENKEFMWVVTDYDTAMDKVNNGDFYAALIIPKDFSKQLVNILLGKRENANVLYYSNQKNSPITPKLIDTGLNTIEVKINNSISKTIYEAILKLAYQITNIADSNAMTHLENSLVKSFDNAKDELDNLNLQMNTLQDMLATLNNALDSIDEFAPIDNSEKLNKLNLVLNEAKEKVIVSKQHIDAVSNILKNLGILSDFQTLLNDMSSICSDIIDGILASQNILGDTKNLNTSLSSSLNSLKQFSNTLNIQLENMKDDFKTISGDLQNAIDRIHALSSTSTLDDVKKIIGSDPGSFANLISAPVVMDRHELYPIENFGTAISGFFVSLSCWAGCLILCTMLTTKLSRKRQKKMEKRSNYKGWQLYFGRYAIYGVMAFLQSTIMCLGCIFFLQIKMVHPFLFLCTGWFVAISFSFFIYTLVASFGSLGKVLAVILLVLQIAASGGTFPIAMVTEIYRYIYPYLPVTYTIKAFNMCIAGFSDVLMYWKYIGLVFGSLTLLSLIIGLVLREPNIRLSHWFEKKLHATKLFAI